MNIDPLDFRPVEVRKLQSMDKGSKEYKKLIQNLKFIYQVLPGSMLYKMLAVKSVEKHIEPDKFYYSFVHKFRKYLITIIGLSVMDFALLFLGYLTIGDISPAEFNKLQTIEFIILISTLVIIVFSIFIFAYKAKKVKDVYFTSRINEKQIRCNHFSDVLLSSVSGAYEFTVNNRQLMDTKEKCGCVNCLKTFYSDEIKDYDDKSVICPYCSTVNVVGETSGYPIDTAFLSAMREYWLDNSD